jgi:hypothetical protein
MQHQATTSSLLGKALQVIQLPKRNQTKNANCGKQAQMVSNSLGFGNPFQNILLRKKNQISPSCIFQFPPFSLQVHNLSSVKNMFKHQVYPYIVCSKPPFFFVKSQFGFVNWLPPIPMDMFVSSPYIQ